MEQLFVFASVSPMPPRGMQAQLWSSVQLSAEGLISAEGLMQDTVRAPHQLNEALLT